METVNQDLITKVVYSLCNIGTPKFINIHFNKKANFINIFAKFPLMDKIHSKALTGYLNSFVTLYEHKVSYEMYTKVEKIKNTELNTQVTIIDFDIMDI